ncbi:glycosyltransferase family 2 protein [Acetobacteraceae bacterium ESL0709]|nr:glycosyltransferase family 2 protein [Acetobacteraceae bacterium ESL0697]MDF7677180.1 glycosyltransferase family 2 protein [Acetobacteraceae bacterium ESL0709]
MKDISPRLSIVVTVLNEADNILPVCKEIRKSLALLPECEVIFVDDGSIDHTRERLLEARRLYIPALRILSHPQCMGKSAALRTAIFHASSQWIATMDGDGQDDPAEIPPLYQEALKAEQMGEMPLIVGVRLKRQDQLSRRLATKFANNLRRRFLHDSCPDTGAPLKVFQRNKFLELPQFEGLHRFLPALMQCYGVTLHCRQVRHRPRLHGHSKYTNLNRALVGIRDLLGVKWLQTRTRYIKTPSEL